MGSTPWNNETERANWYKERHDALLAENEYLRMRLAEIREGVEEIAGESAEGHGLIYCRGKQEVIDKISRLIM